MKKFTQWSVEEFKKWLNTGDDEIRIYVRDFKEGSDAVIYSSEDKSYIEAKVVKALDITNRWFNNHQEIWNLYDEKLYDYAVLFNRNNTKIVVFVSEVVEEGKHKCQYCGNITNGVDIDILCPECREIFGHAFYSEL